MRRRRIELRPVLRLLINTADNLQFRSRFNKSLTWRI
jgi:hypothetical protein